ncbi:MAG: hypothetical protein LQ350_008473 [Teloschistes chrysophthalmus]|nr:MAG: hypothetical protein LQ350_008473 [Niorma chrysophthalma]
MTHTRNTTLPHHLSHRNGTGGLLGLPTELLREITDYHVKRDLKSLRLVCSGLQDLVTPLIFTTAVCALRRGVFDIFQVVVNSPAISQFITELVYDASWFDPVTAERWEREQEKDTPAQQARIAYQQHAEFIAAFREQESILRNELFPALQNAARNFPKLRRLIYADFQRQTSFRGDRVEDLGLDFRVRGEWPPVCKARTNTYPFAPRERDSLRVAMFERSHLGLGVLLTALSEAGCKAQIDDLRIGDGAFSRGAGGVPDVTLEAISHTRYGGSAAFDSLRKLDLTLSQSPIYDPFEWIPSQLPHLECLRLIGPLCSPFSDSYAPSLRTPAIEIARGFAKPVWPKLRYLGLGWITFQSNSLMTFLKSHKDTLRFINLQQIYLHGESTFWAIASGLRSTYPGLVTDPEKKQLPQQDDPGQIIVNLTLHHGEATLINMSEGEHVDDYDEDEVSNYSADEHPEDDERYSSEELEYSDDEDLLMDNELMELTDLY